MLKMKRLKIKKYFKWLWVVLPLALIMALSVILIVNRSYEYDPYGREYMLKSDEQGVLTLYYNGAEGYPESDTVTYEAYQEIELPILKKEGYKFIGWRNYGAFAHKSIILNSKESFVSALFTKDFSNVNKPIAIYTDENNYDEYDAGEYPSVSYKDFYLYIDGGYELHAYSKENFKGAENVYVYSSLSKGHFNMQKNEIKSMKIVPIDSDIVANGELDDYKKAELLSAFAPRIWWAEDEAYFATSVEDAAENMTRVITDSDCRYIIADLDGPDYMNDYLHGNLDKAKAYAFDCAKDEKYLDLSYFVFTPYNKAKEVLGMEFGNHIGDWEHITVRLMKENKNGEINWRPIIVCYSAHDFINCYSWNDIEKVNTTHPVVYTALGSHGMWSAEGKHIYINAFVVKLSDECSQGIAWDIWENNTLETYSYDSLNHTGYGIGNSEWNDCFNFNCYDKNSSAVCRWGNYGWYPPVCIYPSLDGGPTGPQHKQALFDYYSLD